MDFRQLEAFVKVCELQSFSKAAEDIYLSQPSISAYVSALERELEIRLINRSTKDVSPTPAGKIFYEHAKNMLAMKSKSSAVLKRLTDCAVGEISIMASSVPAQYILPGVLAEFNKLYPSIIFRVNQADTAEVVKAVSEQRAEVGFAGAKTDNGRCGFEYFMSDRLVIIAPKGWECKCGDAAELFYAKPFIMREAGSGTRMIYQEFFKELGVKQDKMKICAYLNNTQSIINAVASGLGISIVSETAAKQCLDLGMVTAIATERPMPERKLYLVTKKNCALMPAAEVFIEYLRK